MIRFFAIFFIFWFFSHTLFSQNQIQGKVINANTNEPLAFVNIVINNSQQGTVSDIDGNFYYETSANIFKIGFSYVGFENYIYEGSSFTNLTIHLKPKDTVLEEVTILAGENPAHRIIRQAVKNRRKNNPENLDYFKYNSYNKVYATVENADIVQDTTKLDSLEVDEYEFFKQYYGFLMESITEKKYIAPNLHKEKVIANRVSGLQNPFFASIATTFQPFTFYKDYLTFFEKDYRNPISKGSTHKYFFELKDTLIHNQDSVYIIAYEPREKKNFEGLKGLLYINTNQYAIQNMTALSTDKTTNISFEIQQQYKLVNGTQWFPEQLNADIYLDETQDALKRRTLLVSRSYIKNVDLETQVKRRDFDEVTLEIEQDANIQDSIFWQKYRPAELSIKEQETYQMIDSVGKEVKLDRILNAVEAISRGRISLTVFDVALNRLFRFNRYEGVRLGLGVNTNPKLSKIFTLGGYFGYGFRDDQWKYGGSIDMDLSRRWDIHLGFLYENEVREPGNIYFLGRVGLSNAGVRNFLTERMDRYEVYQSYLAFRPFPNTQVKASLSLQSFEPDYDYSFVSKNNIVGQDAIRNFNNSELAIRFHYAKEEKYTMIRGYKIFLGSKLPILDFNYRRGFQEIWEGEFEYEKWEGKLAFAFKTRGLGTTNIQVQAAQINGNIPYSLLYNGQGSQSSIPVFVGGFFQTMGLYEFVSDRFVNVFFAHDFGRLLLNPPIEEIKPELMLIHNMGWGALTHQESHQNIQLNTLEQGFMETGIVINNLYRSSIGIGYTGFGFSAFYRHGAYQNRENWRKNWNLQIVSTFSF